MSRTAASTLQGLEAVDDFLEAYGRNHRKDVEAIAAFSGWQALAQQEQQARAALLAELLVKRLPEEVLAAIAAGDVDFSAAAREHLQARGKPRRSVPAESAHPAG